MRKHICSFYPIELRILGLMIEEAHSHVVSLPADVDELYESLGHATNMQPDEFGYIGLSLSLDTLHHLNDIVEYVFAETNITDRLKNHLRLVKKAEGIGDE